MPIRKPMTRQLFWAVRMSKMYTLGPNYRGLKKVVTKLYTKWGVPSLNIKRLPWPQIVLISTNFNAFQIENCLKIIIFEKGQLQAYFKQNQDILQEFSGHILKYSQVPKSQIQIRKVKIWTYRLSLQSKRPYHPPTAIRGAVKIFLLDSARKDTGLIIK